MRSGLLAASFAGLLMASPEALGAEDCRLGDRTYPSNATVCSGGIALDCVNGNWQNNDGRRCEGETGSYIGARRPLQERNDEPIPEYIKEQNPELDLR